MRTTLQLALAVCLLGVAIAFAETTAVAETTADQRVILASIRLEGTLPESGGQASLFGEPQVDFRTVLDRLGSAAKDSRIDAILLRIRSPQIGRGKIDELRAAIIKVRGSGKKVYAEVHSAMAAGYLVATACDEIIMPPSGSLIVPGVRAEVMFYKGLLDKLGVKADMIQVGKFKGAAEPYTRNEMSDEFRAQFDSLLDDYYEQLVETIATSRDLPQDKVKELLDVGLFSAADAKAAGLIDHVAYDDEMRITLRDAMGARRLAVVRDYGKEKEAAGGSGLAGLTMLLDKMMGAPEDESETGSPKIAVIYAEGPIMTGESSATLMGGQTVGGETLVKALRKASANGDVKAIVLRINSPGGSALASDLIWREVVRIKKPIVASMGDTAASGGYYIAMGADRIYATGGTLTGSIGVVGGKMALSGLMEKFGVHTDVVYRGKNSGAFSMLEPFSDSERGAMLRMMEQTYSQFTSKVAEGREMDLAKVETLAQGRVFTGRQAVANGLVDEIGTFADAVAAAKELGGLGADEKVDLLILPKQKTLFEQMLGSGVGVSAAQALPAELARPLAEVETLRQLFAEPSVAIMPWRMEIK